LINTKKVAIFISIVIVALSVVTFPRLSYDFRLKPLTSKESDEYRNYEEYSKHFPQSSGSLILLVEFDSEIDELSELQRLDGLSAALDSIHGVEKVHTITQVSLRKRSVLGSRSYQLVSLDSSRFRSKWAKINEYPDIASKFISRDGRSAAIYMDVDATVMPGKVLANIRSVNRLFGFSDYHIVGKQVREEFNAQKLRKETIALPLLALVLMVVLFFLFFRDLRSMVAAVIVLVVNLCVVLHSFVLMGMPISTLTSSVPILVLVISFCDIIHLLNSWKETPERDNKWKTVWGKIGFPLWLTSFTTLSAFLVFLFSPVDAVRSFALLTCVGIVATYCTARWLLPFWVEVIGVKSFPRRPMRGLIRGMIAVLRYRKATVIIGLMALLVIVSLAWQNVKIDHSNSDQTSEDPLVTDLTFLDTHFDGTRSIEVILRDTAVMNPETIHVVDSIENILLNDYGCRSVYSLNTAVKRYNRYYNFGIRSAYNLPNSFSTNYLANIRKYRESLGVTNAVADDEQLMRIVGHLPDVGLAESRIRNEELEKALQAFQSDTRNVFISGFSYLRDQAIYQLTLVVLTGIAISLLVAVLIITVYLKSIRAGVAILIVNVSPIVAGLLIISLSGLDLEPSTVMALSIVLGLSLDDSIYLLSTAGRQEKSWSLRAVRYSIMRNTFPAIATTAILIIGFVTLSLSTVKSNQNIGTLVSGILFISLICDLVILPAMMVGKKG